MTDRTDLDVPTGGPLRRAVDRIFPPTPDFFGLLRDQSALAVSAMGSLVDYMDTSSSTHGKLVKSMEREGDILKERSMFALNRAFSTPMDREDLYRAIATLHHVVNYAKTTVREMELLSVEPDQFTLTMTKLLHQGTVALDDGYGVLESAPGSAEAHAAAARAAERDVEKAYRRALVELFNAEAPVERLQQLDGPTGPAALEHVMDVFKRREVYRHLSNASDRVARAGEVLHDIVVKMV